MSCSDGEGEEERLKAGLKGPTDKRSCQDILWLILFIAFWVGMFVIGGWAIHNGNPYRMLYGSDDFGNVCGRSNNEVYNSDGSVLANSGFDMTGRAHLYYYDIVSSTNLRKECISTCPTSNSLTCTGPGDCDSCQVLDTGDNCPTIQPKQYETTELPYIHRCYPVANGVTPDTLLNSIAGDINSDGELTQIMSDFAAGGMKILWCCLIALGVSIVVIALMRCCVAPFVYTVLILAVGALIGLTAFLFHEFKQRKNKYDDTPEDQRLDQDKRNWQLLEAASIIMLVFTVLVIIILIAMRNRIRLAVAIFEEAAKALTCMPSLYLTPLTTYIGLLALFAYWIVVYVFLASSTVPVTNGTTVIGYNKQKNYDKMWWYHLFGLLWGSQFILASEQLIIASAVAMWYFSRDGGPRGAWCQGVYRLVRYHLGSVALGSLIIALIQLARFILEYVQRKCGNTQSTVVKVLLKILACCLWCFEKCMKFINKNAYIEIAIYGYSFCRAACAAFKAILANILRVAAVNFVGLLVLFMCKLLVVTIICIIAIGWLKDDDSIRFYGLLVLVIGIFTWFIADAFTDVYKMAVDTILLCFCEDSNINNGKDKPYFASDNLVKFLNGSNVAEASK